MRTMTARYSNVLVEHKCEEAVLVTRLFYTHSYTADFAPVRHHYFEKFYESASVAIFKCILGVGQIHKTVFESSNSLENC